MKKKILNDGYIRNISSVKLFRLHAFNLGQTKPMVADTTTQKPFGREIAF